MTVAGTSVAVLAALAAAGTPAALGATAHHHGGAGVIRKAVVASDYFQPGRLTIHVGDRIRWRWDSSGFEQHDVTVASGPQVFHSPTQVSGHYTHRFTKAGTYHLYCTVHEDMTETVVVRRAR